MTEDFWKDAEVISVYTDDQAVEDGVLIPVEFGEISRITNTVMSDFESNGKVDAEHFFSFMKKASAELEGQQKKRDDWFYSVVIEGRKYFLADNGEGFTLMRPEDY
jgi:type I site-specific restriction endonuclease